MPFFLFSFVFRFCLPRLSLIASKTSREETNKERSGSFFAAKERTSNGPVNREAMPNRQQRKTDWMNNSSTGSSYRSNNNNNYSSSSKNYKCTNHRQQRRLYQTTTATNIPQSSILCLFLILLLLTRSRSFLSVRPLSDLFAIVFPGRDLLRWLPNS